MKPLVIVRPEPGASATRKAAGALGLTAIVEPLFEVRPVPWDAPGSGQFDALLLTSANAIRHGGDDLRALVGLPAHCVGEATAEAAAQAGFTVGETGTAGIDALLAELPHEALLLHLCGRHWREPSSTTRAIVHLPVYELVELPVSRRLEVLEDAVVALHSPRSAATLARVVEDQGLRRGTIALAAISDQTAAAAGDGWASIETAREASDEALLAIAARLCQNGG